MRFRYTDEAAGSAQARGAHRGHRGRVFVDDVDVSDTVYAVTFEAAVNAPTRVHLKRYSYHEFIDSAVDRVTVRHTDCSHCTGHDYTPTPVTNVSAWEPTEEDDSDGPS